jgi:peptidoglycan/xylan/chitin deacetylase (PgdA/CDA1 family)
MRLLLAVGCAALLAVPAALASHEGGAYRRPHVALAWEQHRAVARFARVGRPVYCGGGRADAIALTFDDGPGPYTDRLVRILRAYRAHATFFVVGSRVAEWPSAVKEEATVGVIGNHSFSHAHLTGLPHWAVWLDLLEAQQSARAAIGWSPRLFRAPYERHDPSLDSIVSRLGLVEVLWNVDSRDWARHATAKAVARRVVDRLRPGAIVVMHEIHPWTVAAVPRILDVVRRRGWRAVSVPELLALDPPAASSRCLGAARAS